MRSLVLCLFFVLFSEAHATAGVLNFNLIDPNQLGNAIPQSIADEAIRLFGSYTAHRPYSGATSIGRSNTLDMGFETSLVKIGNGLINALNANSIPASTLEAPAIPMVKLSLRKALGDRVDVGLSGLSYKGNSIYGGDLKIVLYTPEEGPSYALRFAYTRIVLPYAYIEKCSTYSPEFVVSQPLYFAESYIGAGARYFTGTMKATVTKTIGPASVTTDLVKDGTSSSEYLFTGVNFKILGAQGLRLGIEGSFDFSGYHSMGMIFGLGF